MHSHSSAYLPSDIYVIRLDGTARHNVTRTPRVAEVAPIPSPDGRSLAYVRYEGSHAAIWLTSTLGTSRRVVDADWSGATPFAWSPDSSRIAFTRFDDSTCAPDARNCATPEVWVIQKDGLNATPVRRGAAAPAWSPHGRYLVVEDAWGQGEA